MSSFSDQLGDKLYGMAVAFRTSQALYVVAKLGVADLLVMGPLGAEELSSKLGVDTNSLFRIMRALAAQGIFTQDHADQFDLSALGRLLVSNTVQSMRYEVIFLGEEYYRAAGAMLHTVKTGETAFNHLYGKSHFEYLGDHPESSKIFNAAMAEFTIHHGNPFESYSLSERHVIVDVGGGRGDLIAWALQSNPELRGIVYDLPQGVTETVHTLASRGVSDRCQIVTGSFFDSIPAGGDVYVMSRVLHDWTDEKAKQILTNCRRAIRDDGVLLLRESVISEGDTPSMGKQMDLTMLFLEGGRERTEKEWQSLLKETGFSLKRVIKAKKGPFDIIEATPT